MKKEDEAGEEKADGDAAEKHGVGGEFAGGAGDAVDERDGGEGADQGREGGTGDAEEGELKAEEDPEGHSEGGPTRYAESEWGREGISKEGLEDYSPEGKTGAGEEGEEDARKTNAPENERLDIGREGAQQDIHPKGRAPNPRQDHHGQKAEGEKDEEDAAVHRLGGGGSLLCLGGKDERDAGFGMREGREGGLVELAESVGLHELARGGVDE